MRRGHAVSRTRPGRRTSRRPSLAGVLFLGIPLLPAACDLTHEARAPEVGVPLPEHWTSAHAAPGEVQDGWWLRFDDPALPALVAEVLANNHDLQATAARIDEAAAQARMARADLLPQVSGQLQASRTKQVFFGIPIPGSSGVFASRFTSYGVSLVTSWEVDLWGRLRAARRAALEDLEATRSDWESARLSLIGQTLKTWFAFVESARQVELAEKTVASFEETAGRARLRFERGRAPSLDVRLALSDLARSRSLLANRRDAHQRTARQLDLLRARYPKGDEAAPAILAVLPEPPPAGIPAAMLARRPDLQAAERRLEAADARFLQARASLLPAIQLTGSGGIASDELQGLTNWDFHVWNLAGSLARPLLDWGRLRAGVDLADAALRGAAETYASAALAALAEVETALDAEAALATSEGHLRETAAQADAAAALAQRRYEAGLADMTTVLVARRAALDARSALLSVQRARLDARVDLHLALGGGFPREEPPPSSPPAREARTAAVERTRPPARVREGDARAREPVAPLREEER